MSPLDRADAPKHWRSLEQLAGDPEVSDLATREFLELLPAEQPSASRRRFLQLAAASVALAGTSGCISPTWPRWPRTKILPYAYRPDGQMDGIPQYFATCMELGGVARALLAKSYDGRPIKLEGNPEHPMSLGAADLWAQASVLDLYDPDRSAGVARFENGASVTFSWEEFLAAFGPVLAERRKVEGEGLHVLAEPSSSPALSLVRARFAKAFPKAVWHEWDPLSRDAAREGSHLAFGRPVRTRYRLDAANVIVSLDDDFLLTHPAAVAYTRAFASRRRADDGTMNRLYVVENGLSVTGTNADARVPVRSAEIPSVAAALASRLVAGGVAIPAKLADAVRSAPDVDERYRATLDAMAHDLLAHPGHALIAVGAAQPPALHALAHTLNHALGNGGATVDWADDPDGDRPGHVASITDLASAMSGGRVEALIVLGGNPVYDAPADLEFGKALASVKASVHVSGTRDETSRACSWHLPRAHYLEAWDGALTWDGTWTIAQPLIHPLHDGRTVAETLAYVLDGAPASGEDLARDAFHARFGGGEGEWRRAVCDGFVAGSDAPPTSVALDSSWSPRAEDFARPETTNGTVEVVFRADLRLLDGRFANNAWLQEMPDPVTKLTWDNAALIAPETALALGIRPGDVLRIAHGPRSIEIPAYLMPGQAAGSLIVALGHGRTHAGRVVELDSNGHGGGVDAYALRGRDALWTALGASIEKTGRRYPLATVQDHHIVSGVENAKGIEGQATRMPELVREATLEHYQEHPDFAKHVVHHPPLESLWTEVSYENGHKWGLSIDLSSCTGCGACVVACQAENNIPVVGKSEVRRGREMHWIRIDRYFTGEPANPSVAHQPVPCMHCENAPCEQVCPVAATLHSEDGLNEMIYNRCIGTRYCSNNCPYKVRRFNWFNNWSDQPEILGMQHNPDVTVRSRGVMEKCTYCVQRIKSVTIPARNDKRPVKDGEIVPACAQTCPAQAIVFGDLNDPSSRVRALADHARSYAMLEELNTKPRTRYLAKLRNPGASSTHPAEHAAATGAHAENGDA